MGTTTNVFDALIKANRGAHPVQLGAELMRQHFMRLAASKSANEKQRTGKQTPSDLIQDAIVKLLQSKGQRFEDASHFLGAIAKAMDRLLIDEARRHKRRPPTVELPVSLSGRPEVTPSNDTERVIQGLHWLSAQFPAEAKVLRCKFYFGMNERVIGFFMRMSVDKVKSHTKRGKLLLREYLESGDTMR
jgi:DNA-directed RNA polymerase specialized sigma24 family protein